MPVFDRAFVIAGVSTGIGRAAARLARRAVARLRGVGEGQAGRPSFLKKAAKNFARCAVVRILFSGTVFWGDADTGGFLGAGHGGRTRKSLQTRDFKSRAFTSFARPAVLGCRPW